VANRFEKYKQPQTLPFKGNPYVDDLGASGVSEDEIYRAMGAEMPAKQNRFAKYSQPQEQFGPAQPPPPKGFFGRVGDKFEQRNQRLAAASENPDFVGGDAGLMYNAVGQTLQKGLWDVPNEAMVSAGRAIPQPVKDFGADVYSNFKTTIPGRVIDPALRGAGYVMGQAAEGYDKFQRNHPTAGLYLDSTLGFGNAALAAVPVRGESIPSRTLAPVERRLNTKTVLPTVQKVKDKSQSLFQSGLQKGASFTDDAADEIIKVVQQERVSDPFATAALGANEMDDVAKRLAEARKNPMTLDSYESLDKEWGSLGHQASIAGKDNLARQYDLLQAKLREVAQNPNFIKGSQDGVNDYQKAVKLWAVRSKMRDIEQINEHAKYYVGGEAAGIKAGYARLAKSNKIYKYSPKEARMIEKAAQTGYTEGLMRTLGSRVMVIGGAIKGGPAGATAAYAASQGFRGGAAAMKGIESGRIGKSIAKEAVKISPDLATTAQRIPKLELQKILKLPPKQAKEAMRAEEMKLLMGPNSARPMTESQIRAAQEAMNKTGSTVRSSAFDLGDVPYNYTAPPAQPGQTPPKMLPAPGKASPLPMTEQEIAIMQAKLNRGTGPRGVDLSGTTPKPPVSQYGKLTDNLGRGKGKQFQDTVQIFKDGDMSQNQFIKDVVSNFGLTPTQARSLAKEIKTYQD